MGLTDADSAEHPTDSRNIIIAPVTCPVPDRREGAPKLSGACRLRIQPGCRLNAIYKANEVEEEYFCNFEVNRQYLGQLESSGMQLSAFDDNGDLRAIELPDHRFFVATLYQPQLSSTEERPHPLIVEFLVASAGLVKSPA
jgi:CTP synthase (UTP-ammonia lyase)